MFYGSDSHAESAAAVFGLVASCRLHHIDPQQYLDESCASSPIGQKERYLELAPKYWPATRSNLRPDELDSSICAFTVPQPPATSRAEKPPQNAGRAAIKMGLVDCLQNSAM